MQNKRKICQCSTIVIALTLSSFVVACSSQQKDRVRIVNSEGKIVNLERKVPKLNAEYLVQEKSSDIKFLGTEEVKADIEKSKQKNVSLAKEADSMEKGDAAVDQKTASAQTSPEEGPVTIIGEENKSVAVITNEEVAAESENVRYVFKTTEKEKARKEKISTEKKPSLTKSADKVNNGFYVQLGAYKFEKNANRVLSDYKEIYDGRIKEATAKGKTIYKVQLGPVSNKTEAQKIMDKVIQKGHYDVFIISGNK